MSYANAQFPLPLSLLLSLSIYFHSVAKRALFIFSFPSEIRAQLFPIQQLESHLPAVLSFRVLKIEGNEKGKSNSFSLTSAHVRN